MLMNLTNEHKPFKLKINCNNYKILVIGKKIRSNIIIINTTV